MKLISSLFSISTNKLKNLLKKTQDFENIINEHEELQEESNDSSDNEALVAENMNILRNHLDGTHKINKRLYIKNYWNTAMKILKFFLVYILFELFYSYCYLANVNWINNLGNYKTEFNQTGQATIHYLYGILLLEYCLANGVFYMLPYLNNRILKEIANKVDIIESNPKIGRAHV